MLNILNKNKTYLVAVSMGPDSMALLNMLERLNYKIIIAHVNYHHRKESDSEEKALKDYAYSHNLKLEIHHAHYQKGNFEAWARDERYAFFRKLVDKYHLEGCIVGHHLDDLLETYLFQIKRKSLVSYYGLKPISEIKGIKIFRPLLRFRKSELELYCKENCLPYFYDITNFDLSLSRNKIRHEIISKLDYYQIKALQEEVKIKNLELDKMYHKINHLLKDQISLKEFNLLSEEEKMRLLFKIANQVDESIILSNRRMHEIISYLEDYQGNKVIKLNEDVYFLKEYDCLKIVKKNMYNYCVTVDLPSVIENQFIRFDLKTNPQRFYIKDDSYPLTIMNVEKSDIIKIGNIHKNVSRILIDGKIPYLKRLYWPKIVDKNKNIIFVPRYSEDENGLFIVKDQ